MGPIVGDDTYNFTIISLMYAVTLALTIVLIALRGGVLPRVDVNLTRRFLYTRQSSGLTLLRLWFVYFRISRSWFAAENQMMLVLPYALFARKLASRLRLIASGLSWVKTFSTSHDQEFGSVIWEKLVSARTSSSLIFFFFDLSC